MPTRIFAITAARETVSLDNQGRAGFSFTASTPVRSRWPAGEAHFHRFDQRIVAKSRGRT